MFSRQKVPTPKTNEFSLAYQVSKYLRKNYPEVIFKLNIADGAKLYSGKAKFQNNLSPRGFPDLFIFLPRKGYYGLAIELKRDGTRLYKRDGTPASIHLREQIEVLNRLQQAGYYTVICVGLESVINEINNYLTN